MLYILPHSEWRKLFFPCEGSCVCKRKWTTDPIIEGLLCGALQLVLDFLRDGELQNFFKLFLRQSSSQPCLHSKIKNTLLTKLTLVNLISAEPDALVDTSNNDAGSVMSLSSLQILLHSSRDTCSTSLSPPVPLSWTAATNRIADREPRREQISINHYLVHKMLDYVYSKIILTHKPKMINFNCFFSLTYLVSVLPSIHFLTLILLVAAGGLQPISASLGQFIAGLTHRNKQPSALTFYILQSNNSLLLGS